MPAPSNSHTSEALLNRLRGGDREALGALFDRHRDRLLRMVRLRMNRRLRGRVTASDVLQETYFEVSARLAEYLREPTMPFFLWLRFLAGQRLAILHRRHLDTRQRDAGREVPLHAAVPEATSAALAARLASSRTGPVDALVRAELRQRLREALDTMHPLDREVLALRHFEQLRNTEAAAVMGLSEAAASKRYVRALARLREILTRRPGASGDLLS